MSDKEATEEEIAELIRVRAYIDNRLKELAATSEQPLQRPDKKALIKKYSALRK